MKFKATLKIHSAADAEKKPSQNKSIKNYIFFVAQE